MVPSPSGIGTPDKVRELQIALFLKAKVIPSHRFWRLCGELSRREVLERALDAQLRNGGTTGVDGGSLAEVKADRAGWLGWMQKKLETKTYRPSRCGG
jgi:hypothetical protein